MKKLIEKDERILTANDSSEFYRELTHRNQHFVPPHVQQRLRDLKILIAGCGAGGGACTTPLARLGVTHFRLADNGNYEISNLNRQHTFVDRLGENKAEFHASELLRINPHIDVLTYADGISKQNLPELVQWADLIIDAVDVTNPVSIKLKFHLHEVAHRFQKPVMSPLDPGFCQMGFTYDYRNRRIRPLNGKLEACLQTQHPIKALLTMFPLSKIPNHVLPLVEEILEKPEMPASQLGASADLLSGIVAAAVIRFATDGKLIPGWNLTVEHYAYSSTQRVKFQINSLRLRKKIKNMLQKLP